MGDIEEADLAAKAALLQAYVDLVNSARETIWARHNAMLVANSLIVGAIAISPAQLWTHERAAIGLLAAGLCISLIWFLITIHGWLALQRHVEMARDFTATCLPGLANPFVHMRHHRSEIWIHALVLLLIAVFVSIYLGLGYFRLTTS
jgi:uncharacterized membrane protein